MASPAPSTSRPGDTPNDALREHLAQMRSRHDALLWVHLACVLVGAWLVAAPWTLGLVDAGGFGPRVAQVSAERGLAPPAARAMALAWSDVASGAALVVFGALSVFPRHRWAQWGSCFVGLWLLCAPLLLWAPSAAAYANDTLAGTLAIAFSVLVPMMPGMSPAAMMAPQDIPAGWDYSPSSWSQRLPIIVLAFVGFFIARYLTAYQLGHIPQVADPFFADGTRRVITSDVSRAWPVPDAGVGALSYLLEALSGMMGGRQRWRTMPWMVAMFGVLVIPLGAVSIFFIVIQPIVIGTWCTLCLVSAAAMVVMLPFSFDEIVAMGQFLLRARRDGQSLWAVFWHGGAVPGGRVDGSPPLVLGRDTLRRVAREAAALPRGLALSTALGVWLMFTRLTLDTGGAMADSDHLVGALVVTVSVCAFSEVARPLRALNLVFGAWLLAAPWLLAGASLAGAVASMLCGLALIGLALPRGPVQHHYSGWDRYLAW